MLTSIQSLKSWTSSFDVKSYVDMFIPINPNQYPKQVHHQQQLDTSRKFVNSVLPPQDIINVIENIHSIKEFLDGILENNFNAQQALAVYCRRALEFNEKHNWISEIFIQDAMHQAKQHDAYFETTGKLYGPLHGVPFAVSDEANVIGVGITHDFTQIQH
jgi:hypothetical protein